MTASGSDTVLAAIGAAAHQAALNTVPAASIDVRSQHRHAHLLRTRRVCGMQSAMSELNCARALTAADGPCGVRPPGCKAIGTFKAGQ